MSAAQSAARPGQTAQYASLLRPPRFDDAGEHERPNTTGKAAAIPEGPSAETLEWNKNSSSELEAKNREEDLMDRITRCPKCGKRMVPVATLSGRTDLQCISCEDPAVKWAESPRMAPEEPIVPERT
jgi:hypothetical protein